MCGFILIYDKKIDYKKAEFSLEAMIHRGPDQQRISIDNHIFMGFNRLSIQDLSLSAMQPMYENLNNHKIYLMFNGEIYNFLELKKKNDKINKLSYRSNSDTEIISKLYITHGLEKTLDLLDGMFALCLYDKTNQRILLARDLFGQKPLYYYYLPQDNFFIASSEIKGIISYIDGLEPDFFGSLNPILQTGISPSNSTMFKNIKRLLPGEIMVFDLKTKKLSLKKHLKIKNLINENEYRRINLISQSDLIEEYSGTLSKTVKNHTISDAPIAVAASLGLDSSIIMDLLISSNTKKINCISYISQEDEKIFEHKSIKKYFLKTNHFHFSEYGKNFIENLIYSTYYCEGIGREDNMILSEISKIAKRNGIKVLLTGDGADELFGSIDYQQKFYYNSIGFNNKFLRKINLLLKNYFPLIFNIFTYYSPLNEGYFIYPNHLSSLELTSNLLLYGGNRKKEFDECLNSYSFINNENERNYHSIILDDLSTRFQRFLNRSDSYGMQNSVEVRLPYLGKEFVNLCLNTPIKRKIEHNFFSLEKKSLLKKLAKNLNIPQKIIYRKKSGTDFLKKNFYKKLILKEDFKFLSDMFKLSPTKLKEALLDNNFQFFSRELFSFLSAENLFKMYIDKATPEDLTEKYKQIIRN